MNMKPRIDRRYLLQCDGQGSVLLAGERVFRKYEAYGFSALISGALGYCATLQEPSSKGYLLGNGYRLYNPLLRRFQSPDSVSPFGAGGFNCYVYCGNDPVNFVDPDGHSRLFKWLSRIFSRSARSASKLQSSGLVRSSIAGRVPGSSGARKPASGLSIVNVDGSAVVPGSSQMAGAEEFLGVARSIGDTQTWSSLRSQLNAQQSVFGDSRLGEAQGRLSIFGRQREIAELQYQALLPSYDYATGLRGGKSAGNFVSDDVFAYRVLGDARTRLRNLGLDVVILRNPPQKKPAISGRYSKHRS